MACPWTAYFTVWGQEHACARLGKLASLLLLQVTCWKPALGREKLCVPQVLANAPFSALYYTFYSSLQRRFQQARCSPTSQLVHAAL